MTIDLPQPQTVDVQPTRSVTVDLGIGVEILASAATPTPVPPLLSGGDQGHTEVTPLVPNSGEDVTDSMIAAGATRRRNAVEMLDQYANTPLPLAAAAATGAAVSGRATLSVLPADWAQQRVAILERLGAIEAALAQIAPLVERLEIEQPQHGGIGHNQPPEPLPIDTPQIQLGISAANVIRTQVSEEPDPEVVRLCGLALKQVWKGTKALARYVAKNGDVFIGAAAKSAGDAAGKAIIGAGALGILLSQLNIDLADVIARIEQLLRLIGLAL